MSQENSNQMINISHDEMKNFIQRYEDGVKKAILAPIKYPQVKFFELVNYEVDTSHSYENMRKKIIENYPEEKHEEFLKKIEKAKENAAKLEEERRKREIEAAIDKTGVPEISFNFSLEHVVDVLALHHYRPKGLAEGLVAEIKLLYDDEAQAKTAITNIYNKFKQLDPIGAYSSCVKHSIIDKQNVAISTSALEWLKTALIRKHYCPEFGIESNKRNDNVNSNMFFDNYLNRQDLPDKTGYEPDSKSTLQL